MDSRTNSIPDPFLTLRMSHNLQATSVFCLSNHDLQLFLAELRDLRMIGRTHHSSCCMNVDDVCSSAQHFMDGLRHFFRPSTNGTWASGITMKCIIDALTLPFLPMSTCCR